MARFTPEENQEARAHLGKARKALHEVGKALWDDGTIDAKLKDMVRLRSAQLMGCLI